jgi:hypothetical protein
MIMVEITAVQQQRSAGGHQRLWLLAFEDASAVNRNRLPANQIRKCTTAGCSS